MAETLCPGWTVEFDTTVTMGQMRDLRDMARKNTPRFDDPEMGEVRRVAIARSDTGRTIVRTCSGLPRCGTERFAEAEAVLKADLLAIIQPATPAHKEPE